MWIIALDNSDRSQFSSIHESAVGLSQLLNQTQRTSFATNRDVSTVPSPDSLAESRIGFDLPDNDADDRLDFGNEENGPVVSVPMQILSTNKL